MNYKLKDKLQGGFTLLEVVIYVGLVAGALSLVIVMFYSLLDSERRNGNRMAVEAEANFLMHKLSWALTGAQSVSQPAVGATSTTLSLTKYNFAGNPLVFDLASSSVRLGRAGGEIVPLTSGRVAVTALVFEHLSSTPSRAEGVNFKVTIRGTAPGFPIASTTLDSTIYLRK
ncbi:MAG: hypothetical protein AAB686_02600 [Patescibacteria group bacterium]